MYLISWQLSWSVLWFAVFRFSYTCSVWSFLTQLWFIAVSQNDILRSDFPVNGNQNSYIKASHFTFELVIAEQLSWFMFNLRSSSESLNPTHSPTHKHTREMKTPYNELKHELVIVKTDYYDFQNIWFSHVPIFSDINSNSRTLARHINL